MENENQMAIFQFSQEISHNHSFHLNISFYARKLLIVLQVMSFDINSFLKSVFDFPRHYVTALS